MQTHIRIPGPPLSQYVDLIWYSKAGVYNSRGTLIPMLQPELVFNFSAHFSVQTASCRTIENKLSWLTGLQTQPMQSATAGWHQTIGVLLKPWALCVFTGIPACEFTGTMVEGDLVWPQEVPSLYATLAEATTIPHKLNRFEEFLLSKCHVKPLPVYVRAGTQFLQKNTLREGITAELASQLNMSRKTLIAAFRQYIGLSPGRFQHLCLVNHILQELKTDPSQSLTELAYRYNFYDQAHFIHSFKKISGLTPSGYRHLVQQGLVADDSPNYWQAAGSG